MMRIHTLEREQELPGTPRRSSTCFADARNLEAITPPLLRFEVVTPGEVDDARRGAHHSTALHLHGVPIVDWLTSIQDWDPPHRFIDQQVRGPFALWHHTHELFPSGPGGTRMRDTVRYAIGYGPLGELATACSSGATWRRSSTSARGRSRIAAG